MAKKQTDESTTALATSPESTTSAALAVADRAVAGDSRGTEGIDSEDVRLPFLSIAQKTSEALERGTAKYIEGLEFAQMYNSETQAIYGESVEFIPVAMRKRACLVLENGRMGEEIAWDDKRASWDEARAQNRKKPEALQIYDWIVVLLPSFETAVVSFKSKSFGAGKSLNGFVKLRKPSFAGKYVLATVRDKNDSGPFAKFAVRPAGKPSDVEFEFAETVYNSVKDQKVVTNENADVIETTAVVDSDM
jgi:hypothetical protein